MLIIHPHCRSAWVQSHNFSHLLIVSENSLVAEAIFCNQSDNLSLPCASCYEAITRDRLTLYLHTYRLYEPSPAAVVAKRFLFLYMFFIHPKIPKFQLGLGLEIIFS